jgi:predicted nucleic acid-binding protein
MIPKAVVDSCVAYKWLRPFGEAGVPEALALVEASGAGKVELVAPTIMPVELTNVIRSARLPLEAALALVREIDNFHVTLYSNDVTRLAEAVRLAYRHDLAIYDALFLALAEELDCPLVTADRKAFSNIDTKVEIRLL